MKAVVLIFAVVAVLWIARRRSWPIAATRTRMLLAGLLIFLTGGLAMHLAAGVLSQSPKAGQSGETPEQVQSAYAAAYAQQPKVTDEDLKRIEANNRRILMATEPQRFLTISNTHATSAGFGAVFLLRGRVTNKGELGYKDPVITCDVYSATATLLGHVRATLYKEIQPGKSVSFSDFNMGFANPNWQKYQCGVEGAAKL